MRNAIYLRKPDDWHVHLREGEMLAAVLPYTARYAARALVMPNLASPRVTTAEHILAYRREIEAAAKAKGVSGFEPLMTVKLTPQTTPEIMRQAKQIGVLAGKLYPEGVTTGSEGGIRDFRALYPVFEEMKSLDLVLSLHGEMPGSEILVAEQDFIPVLRDLIRDFPGLRIIVEHVSSKAMVEFLSTKDMPETVGATITPQHLVLTYYQAIANPHNFCKPVSW